MPPETTRLRDGAAALGEALSEAQIHQLLAYLDLLQRWNATYNLTAVRERDAMVTQHLLDCIAVVPMLRRWLALTHGAGARVLDVGSGGGLPGVVLAALVEGIDVTCVDAVGKKTAFVQHVAAALGLKQLRSVHGRVEQLQLLPFQLVIARAFATLSELVRVTQMHLAPTGCWMAMKGKQPIDEITSLATSHPEIAVFHVEQLLVPGLNAERCLIGMRPQPRA